MADATLGSRSTQASANCERVQPAFAATGFNFCTVSSVSRPVQRWMNSPIFVLVAQESAGSGAPGRYFPARTPCASGDQTIGETCFSRQSGMTFSSGWRQSRDYCGWLETKHSMPGRVLSSNSLAPLGETNKIGKLTLGAGAITIKPGKSE